MKAFDGLFGSSSCFKPVGRVNLVMSNSRVVVPDEGNSSRGVAEAGLEESAAHNLVRNHQGCQGLTNIGLVQRHK